MDCIRALGTSIAKFRSYRLHHNRRMPPVQTVDKAQSARKKSVSKTLQRQRKPDLQKSLTLIFNRKSFLVISNGSCFFIRRIMQIPHYMPGRPRRNCRTGCIHMKSGHQSQIAEDIDDTGYQHEQKRRFTVAKSSENCRQQVISYNEENSCSTNPHIGSCQIHSLCGEPASIRKSDGQNPTLTTNRTTEIMVKTMADPPITNRSAPASFHQIPGNTP